MALIRAVEQMAEGVLDEDDKHAIVQLQHMALALGIAKRNREDYEAGNI